MNYSYSFSRFWPFGLLQLFGAARRQNWRCPQLQRFPAGPWAIGPAPGWLALPQAQAAECSLGGKAMVRGSSRLLPQRLSRPAVRRLAGLLPGSVGRFSGIWRKICGNLSEDFRTTGRATRQKFSDFFCQKISDFFFQKISDGFFPGFSDEFPAIPPDFKSNLHKTRQKIPEKSRQKFSEKKSQKFSDKKSQKFSDELLGQFSENGRKTGQLCQISDRKFRAGPNKGLGCHRAAGPWATHGFASAQQPRPPP